MAALSENRFSCGTSSSLRHSGRLYGILGTSKQVPAERRGLLQFREISVWQEDSVRQSGTAGEAKRSVTEMAQIVISDLSFCYEGSSEQIFEHVSLNLDTDWKLGLIGRNGKGKTTFLRLLLGEYAYQGSIRAPEGFAYFPFDTAGMENREPQLLWRPCFCLSSPCLPAYGSSGQRALYREV